MSQHRRSLLQVGPLPPGLQRLASDAYDLQPLWTQPDRAAFLSAQAGRFGGAITMSRHGAQADIMAALGAAPHPTVVACFGVGYEGIDLAAAAACNVAVSTTPDVLTDCVADLAFALLLGVARQITAAERFVRAGAWMNGAFPLATKVSGKRLGILGLGRIGAAIARRAAGFDMTIRYHGRRARPGVPYEFMPYLVAMAEWADVLMISCQGGAETRHLVDAAVLRALGPQGCVVNIARGSVIDDDALIAALAENALGAAALDVYAQEPTIPAALLNDDRVLTLPHIAASTRETRAAMEALVMDNLAAFFRTGAVLTPPG